MVAKKEIKIANSIENIGEEFGIVYEIPDEFEMLGHAPNLGLDKIREDNIYKFERHLILKKGERYVLIYDPLQGYYSYKRDLDEDEKEIVKKKCKRRLINNVSN